MPLKYTLLKPACVVVVGGDGGGSGDGGSCGGGTGSSDDGSIYACRFRLAAQNQRAHQRQPHQIDNLVRSNAGKTKRKGKPKK